jgi:hypothetical protein
MCTNLNSKVVLDERTSSEIRLLRRRSGHPKCWVPIVRSAIPLRVHKTRLADISRFLSGFRLALRKALKTVAELDRCAEGRIRLSATRSFDGLYMGVGTWQRPNKRTLLDCETMYEVCTIRLG